MTHPPSTPPGVEQVKPLDGKALIKEDPLPEKSEGGLYIPRTAKDGKFSTTAEVLAVGKGKRLKGGGRAEVSLKPGDKIILPKHHGTEFDFDGEKCRIIDMDVVDGIIED